MCWINSSNNLLVVSCLPSQCANSKCRVYEVNDRYTGMWSVGWWDTRSKWVYLPLILVRGMYQRYSSFSHILHNYESYITRVIFVNNLWLLTFFTVDGYPFSLQNSYLVSRFLCMNILVYIKNFSVVIVVNNYEHYVVLRTKELQTFLSFLHNLCELDIKTYIIFLVFYKI